MNRGAGRETETKRELIFQSTPKRTKTLINSSDNYDVLFFPLSRKDINESV